MIWQQNNSEIVAMFHQVLCVISLTSNDQLPDFFMVGELMEGKLAELLYSTY